MISRYSTMLSDFIGKYIHIIVSFVITILLVRVFEFYQIGNKTFVNRAFFYELLGIVYDVWACLIYLFIVSAIVYLLQFIHKNAALYVFHILNAFAIFLYIGLIVIFKERNTPFDHELFTRNFMDSWVTSKQMMTGDLFLFFPFVFYIALYFLLSLKILNRFQFSKNARVAFSTISLIALVLSSYANPAENKFENRNAYYLTSNKFTFWVADVYNYYKNLNKFNPAKLNPAALKAEIDFYQANQPFQFTSDKYPLMHVNKSNDVLGSFFNLNKNEPPNIVILVVEGLSRDFSGDNAYASSFTPFLDSLSNQSLTWNNFLSTAPGTFAAHPAITGSLPYGKKGFSIINVMPDHLSLIKILKNNGYHTKFLIGFNPDFDNMGGYMRLQGTDMILSNYGAKYKQMGVGEEGWSMGYPDDALYSRSFEVMDSLKQTPYLNIYHTGTTHMPYLFEQQHQYEKLFDQKMTQIKASSAIKKTLINCKPVLATFMFSDDCIKKFFKTYSRRPDFKNTIFFIMGDHHIGSFPSTAGLDDYHVPLIVYSPLLKHPQKFYSLNTHNNIAPTISALILNNYPQLKSNPKEVHWLTSELDTAVRFRNQNAMPFMEWSREITDYIYKDYYLSGEQLYKVDANLNQTKQENDSVKNYMIHLRDNFKLINNYVCDNNLIYPGKSLDAYSKKELLFTYNNPEVRNFNLTKQDTTIAPEIKVNHAYKYLYMEVTADVNLLSKDLEDQPAFRLAMIDTAFKKRNFLYWTNHNIVQLTKGDFIEHEWNPISTNDMFAVSDFVKSKHLLFDLSLFTTRLPIQLQLRNLKVKVYGIK